MGGRGFYGASGYPGRVLNFSVRVLKFSTQPPTRVCDPNRSKNTALGVFRPPPGGGVGDLFCPLDHVDWGIFGQLATRATGHFGFGVFTAEQCLWHGGSLLQGRVAL